MNLDAKQILSRLGRGESIADLCSAAGINRSDFDEWWAGETQSRVPGQAGTTGTAVGDDVIINRDKWGIPYINALSDSDLFIGFGYAMSQDRLFQLDWLRRKASGNLSEIVGEEGLEDDTVARTVGLRRIAEAEWRQSPDETRMLLESFSKGVNVAMAECGDRLPIEFDLLDYQPDPWSPIDTLAILGEFRYYLTVRFPIIVGPELGKRVLGEGNLYQALLQGEAEDETVVPRGSYTQQQDDLLAVGVTVSDAGEGGGSNNWAVSGSRAVNGKPMVADDPHTAFGAVSTYYEVGLKGQSFDVVGVAHAGIPAIMFGRNRRMAFSVTNNHCSQRDLYQERVDHDHPGSFFFDGAWETAKVRTEEIRVRGSEPVRKIITSSRNGPIVDEILPPAARGTGPVSLRWLGTEYCTFLTSMLGINRAGTPSEFRDSLSGWLVPTWHLVFGDVDGNIGYQTAGHVPQRKSEERGYRPGWDPDHQWLGLVPRDGMPGFDNPERGWIASANNRIAPPDYPYPLYGRWYSGFRARRIRQMIEAKGTLSRQDFFDMHQDALSLRAIDRVPHLTALLHGSSDDRVQAALQHLMSWDCKMEPDRVGASIFEVFFNYWTRRVASERLGGEVAEMMAGSSGGLAASLLESDTTGWFTQRDRTIAVEETMKKTLDELEHRLGDDMSSWEWGRLHTVQLYHVLTGRGDLGDLLDLGGLPVKGNGFTVCNTGFDPNYLALGGAMYRQVSDMGSEPEGMFAVDAQGSSGHPGSPHYGDQLVEWINGRYHFMPFDNDDVRRITVKSQTLVRSVG